MDDLSPGRAPRRAPVFALLLAGAVSEFGNVLTFVAVPWFVLETTGSAARTGLTGGAVTLAVVVAGIFGGPIVDRLGFKRTSVLADLASGATVAAIPLLYHTVGLAYWQLLVLVFLGALLDAPGLTARQSMAPDLAQMAGIRAARVNSALQAIQQAALLLGPPVAGGNIPQPLGTPPTVRSARKRARRPCPSPNAYLPGCGYTLLTMASQARSGRRRRRPMKRWAEGVTA